MAENGERDLLKRLDVAIVKLTDVSNDIKQVLAVHEQRFDAQEGLNTVYYDQIEKLHQRIGDLRDEMMKKMNDIERWRGSMLGAAGVVGFLCSTTSVGDLFK